MNDNLPAPVPYKELHWYYHSPLCNLCYLRMFCIENFNSLTLRIEKVLYTCYFLDQILNCSLSFYCFDFVHTLHMKNSCFYRRSRWRKPLRLFTLENHMKNLTVLGMFFDAWTAFYSFSTQKFTLITGNLVELLHVSTKIRFSLFEHDFLSLSAITGEFCSTKLHSIEYIAAPTWRSVLLFERIWIALLFAFRFNFFLQI